jgi:type 2 lantibiotic biosynthesis protein LanM
MDTPLPIPATVAEYALAAALQPLAPLIRQGQASLHTRVEELAARYPITPFDPATIVETLYSSLAPLLIRIASRVMVLELHVARLSGHLLQETPAERFAAFFRRLCDPVHLAELFDEYPVLARRLVECIDTWVTTSAEFLTRLCADWEALCQTFFAGSHPGRLVYVEGSVGDTHRGGHAVHIVQFASGHRVVYKPRSLAVDGHFQALLMWLNARGQYPPFRTITLLERPDYGWVEFVTASACQNTAELERFYQRQGGYLALLYALEATDFHHENLIAVGEHPVLIDLEALFHPHLALAGSTGSFGRAGAMLDDSVLRIGMLPIRVYSDPSHVGIDVSGLGGAAGQMTPFAVPYWERRGTDEISLAYKHVEIPVEANRPSLNGADTDVLAFTEAIVAGFEWTYCLLAAQREALMAPTGPLSGFAHDDVRVIARPTARYDELLRLSYHPDVLRDALDRDRFFDRLWIEVAKSPQLGQLVAAEQADLWAGDIPLFQTRPGSREVWTARGVRLADFLAEPSLTHVHRRLQRLSDSDQMLQVQFIRTALASLQIGRDPIARVVSSFPAPPTQTAPGVLQQRLITAACAVGDELAATAICAGDEVNWVGMTLVHDRFWSLSPLETDLYTGLPGMALFLGCLGAATGEERYTHLGRQALTTLVRRLEQTADRLTNIGAFSGWGGILYVLSQLGPLYRDTQLLDLAVQYARRIPALVDVDTGLDLINGSAGCILTLLCLYREAPTHELLHTATLCGERLLATARSVDQGSAWETPVPASRPLCGLSHGSAGMALALAALGTATEQARFHDAARAALAYEAGAFSPEHGNWPDWRCEETPQGPTGGNQTNFMVSWCHGAPGIGLSRLALRAHLGYASSSADLDAAIATTMARGFGHNHSLCHGDTGNLEFLADASRALGDEELSRQVQGGAAALLDSIAQQSWRCGVPTGVQAPGLMVGLAGIGYGLLRLAFPEQVPSVLTLQPAGRVATTQEGGISYDHRAACDFPS